MSAAAADNGLYSHAWVRRKHRRIDRLIGQKERELDLLMCGLSSPPLSSEDMQAKLEARPQLMEITQESAWESTDNAKHHPDVYSYCAESFRWLQTYLGS